MRAIQLVDLMNQNDDIFFNFDFTFLRFLRILVIEWNSGYGKKIRLISPYISDEMFVTLSLIIHTIMFEILLGIQIINDRGLRTIYLTVEITLGYNKECKRIPAISGTSVN